MQVGRWFLGGVGVIPIIIVVEGVILIIIVVEEVNDLLLLIIIYRCRFYQNSRFSGRYGRGRGFLSSLWSFKPVLSYVCLLQCH
jgi:hypothetical protein